MNRKDFLLMASSGFAGITIYQNLKINSNGIPKSLVKEFVSAGHDDINRVKEMLDDIPNLLYARYDWSYGDFESALEGASHVGHIEIANYLIQKGARASIVTLTMLGKDQLVKSLIENYPHMLHTRGAHGFTLLHHARVGGKGAENLFFWLKEQGLKTFQMK